MKHLEECLDSVFRQDFTDFEVLMVDNASHDGSPSFVEQRYPQVQVVRSPNNLGFAGGNNFGFSYCRGDYIFFLNNDTRLAPDALSALANAVETNPEINAFSGLLIDYYNPDRVDSAGDTIYTNGFTFSFSGYPVSMFQHPRFVTAACGGAAIYSRKLLDKIGLFDEDFFLIYEDLDLSFRARHAGEKILFLPSCKVFHKGSASIGTKGGGLRLYYSERNIGLFILKNYPARVLARYLPDFIFRKVLGIMGAVKRGDLITFLRANLDTLKLAPSAYRKRKKILELSLLSPKEFDAMLRRNWLKERMAFKNGKYDIPI